MRKCAAFRPRRSRYRSRAVNQMAALMCDTLEGLLPIVYTGLLGTLTEVYRSADCMTVDCVTVKDFTGSSQDQTLLI